MATHDPVFNEVEIQRRRLRLMRLRLMTAIVPLFVGGSWIAFRPFIHEIIPLKYSSTWDLLAVIFAAQGAIYLIFLYLRGEIALPFLDSLQKRPVHDFEYGRAESEISMLRSELRALRTAVARNEERPRVRRESLTEKDKTELFSTLKAEITSDLDSRLLAELEERYSGSAKERLSRSAIRDLLASSSNRLEVELSALARRGSLNLAIGVVTTVAAVGLLVYMVTGAEASFTDFKSLISYYLPRLSVAVFIEIFAFFFLRLYKSTLEEARYYQNELTNLSTLSAALEGAMLVADVKVIAAISEILARTDRNQRTAVRAGAPPASSGIEASDVSKLLDNIGKLVEKTLGKGVDPGSG